jgi:hypothetical protein
LHNFATSQLIRGKKLGLSDRLVGRRLLCGIVLFPAAAAAAAAVFVAEKEEEEEKEEEVEGDLDVSAPPFSKRVFPSQLKAERSKKRERGIWSFIQGSTDLYTW